LSYRYYGADNAQLPRSGLTIQAGFSWYQVESGFESFPQAVAHISYFKPVSEARSALFAAEGGTAFGTSVLDLGLQSFSLGGPLRLGAYGQNELLGNHYFLLQTGYEHKLLPLSPLVGEGVYALGLIEFGKVYGYPNSEPAVPLDGSLAVVARTAIGPVFIGGSLGNAGHRKWWFGVGRTF
jgi:NTE family protein